MTEDVDHEGVSAVVFHREKQKYLLMKRSEEKEINPSVWEFPGGAIDEGESPREAVIRELEEETSLKADVKRLGEPFIWNSHGEMFRNHPFLVEVDGEVEKSHEHTEIRWVGRETLEEYSFVRNIKGLEALNLI